MIQVAYLHSQTLISLVQSLFYCCYCPSWSLYFMFTMRSMDRTLRTDGFIASETKVWQLILWMLYTHDQWCCSFTSQFISWRLVDRRYRLIAERLCICCGWHMLLVFVWADFRHVIWRIGDLPTDFGDASIILEFFIIFPAISIFPNWLYSPIDSLQLNNTGGI